MIHLNNFKIYIFWFVVTTLIFYALSISEDPLCAKEKKPALKTWYKGPVRYIITKEEEIIFKSLETEEDRAAFINRFWKRRDPTPGTHENEFRYNFWKMVIDANTLFAETTKPGWKTDRGKVYIIMGPPQEIEDDSYFSMIGTPSSSDPRGLIRWIYQGTGRLDIDPLITVPFVKDTGGEYRLSADPRLNSIFYDRLRSHARGNLGLLKEIKRFNQEAVSELAVTLDLGKLQQLPSEEDIFTEIITDKEYYDAIPLQTSYDFYLSEIEDTTVTSLTIGIKKTNIPSFQLDITDSPQLLLVARFIGAGDEIISYTFPEATFLPSPDNEQYAEEDVLIYQMKAPISPGKYKVLIGIFDSESEFIGSFHEFLEIPYIDGRILSLSSVAFAAKMNQSETPSRTTLEKPFQFGDFHVIPRLQSDFKMGEVFSIFYQIYYNPSIPETSPEKDIWLEGSYEILKKDDQGTFQKLWKPIPFDIQIPPSETITTINRGWSFQIENFPSADYKLIIHVTQKEKDVSAKREVEFSIEDL